MNTHEENWIVATALDPDASDRIQAVLACIKDNSDLQITLRDPVPGGWKVFYELGSGDERRLTGCCGLRDVERHDDYLLVPHG